MQETKKKKRLINFIIDKIILVALLLISFNIGIVTGYESLFKALGMFIFFAGYYIGMEFMFGKTVGKYFTKSKVVNKDGSKIDLRTTIIRNLCRWIPFEPFSILLGYDAKAWHDLISKTRVVDEE